MPAATTKAALLAVTEKEFGKLQVLLDRVPLPQTTAAGPEGDPTTLKDIVGHRAAWITLCPGWYADGQAGKDVAIPAPGDKWNDLKRFNADLRESQAGLTRDDARALLCATHTRLTAFLGALDDKALYGAPMKGGGNVWTTGRRADAAGPSHYRPAARVIRARLRALANSSRPD